MKIRRTSVSLTIIITLLIISCQNEQSIEGCYKGLLKQDIVSLQLSQEGDSISGQLEYDFYEKDKNSGTVKGSIVRDTLLLLDYTFQSEGSQSMRQVAFIIEDNESLAEVHGEMSITNDGLKFKDTAHLKSGHSFVLNKINCKNPD